MNNENNNNNKNATENTRKAAPLTINDALKIWMRFDTDNHIDNTQTPNYLFHSIVTHNTTTLEYNERKTVNKLSKLCSQIDAMEMGHENNNEWHAFIKNACSIYVDTPTTKTAKLYKTRKHGLGQTGLNENELFRPVSVLARVVDVDGGYLGDTVVSILIPQGVNDVFLTRQQLELTKMSAEKYAAGAYDAA